MERGEEFDAILVRDGTDIDHRSTASCRQHAAIACDRRDGLNEIGLLQQLQWLDRANLRRHRQVHRVTFFVREA